MQKIKNLKLIETPENIKKQWSHALSYRNMLLEKTDWTQSEDCGLTKHCVAKFRDWRDRLRAINAKNGVPFEAVVQVTKTIANIMPELEWEHIKDEEPIQRCRAAYIKDISKLTGSLSNEFSFDIKVLDNNVESMISFERGIKTKDSINHLITKYGSVEMAASELALLKRNVIKTITEIVDDKKNTILLINEAESDTVCNDVFKAYCEKIDGYRHRLLEIFNT